MSVSHPADGTVKSQKAEKDGDEAERHGEKSRVYSGNCEKWVLNALYFQEAVSERAVIR